MFCAYEGLRMFVGRFPLKMNNTYCICLIACLTFGSSGCLRPPIFVEEELCQKTAFKGVWVLNEGQFTQNEATLALWDEQQRAFCSDVFGSVNGKPLGDVANQMLRVADTMYILMTGSALVYKIQLPSLKLIAETRFPQGFYLQDFAVAAENELWITAFNVVAKKYEIFVLNSLNMQIEGEIALPPHPYGIACAGEYAYVACGNYPNQSPNNQLAVVHIPSRSLSQLVSLPRENPTQICLYQDKVAVLCAGNYVATDSSSVVSFINRHNLQSEKNVYFRGSVYEICVSGAYLLGVKDAENATNIYEGTSLFSIKLDDYTVNPSVKQDLDFEPRRSGNFLYKLFYDEAAGKVWVTFSTGKKGYVLNPFMQVVDSFRTGLYPSQLLFDR